MRYFTQTDIREMGDTQLESLKQALLSFDCTGVECYECAFACMSRFTGAYCVYKLIENELAQRADIYKLRRKHFLFDK